MSSKCLSVISRLVSLNQNTSFVHERHHELTIQQLLSLMFTLKSRRRCECCAVINMVLNPSAGGGGLTVCAGILMDINLISFLSMEQSQVSHTCRTSSSPSLSPSGTSTPQTSCSWMTTCPHIMLVWSPRISRRMVSLTCNGRQYWARYF